MEKVLEPKKNLIETSHTTSAISWQDKDIEIIHVNDAFFTQMSLQSSGNSTEKVNIKKQNSWSGVTTNLKRDSL
jgi:hypothetical protein